MHTDEPTTQGDTEYVLKTSYWAHKFELKKALM